MHINMRDDERGAVPAPAVNCQAPLAGLAGRDSLDYADPALFDHLAVEMLKLPEGAAPRRTSDATLAAIRAAS